MYLERRLGPARPDRRIRLHLPTARDERRLAVPPYGRSYFELVRRAFHRRARAATDRPRGAAAAARRPRDPRPRAAGRRLGIATKWDAWRRAPRTELVPIAWPDRAAPDGQGPISQLQLVYRSDVGGRLRAVLAAAPGRAGTAKGPET